MSKQKNTPREPKTHDHGEVLELERELMVEPPPLYKVWLLNDDFTPMDFVVEVLRDFFYKTEEEAEQIMLRVHHEGRAVCGQYPRDVAETKVMRVLRHARAHGHPLQCVMENV
ncbi:MAG: ATP-dependent Clp protease adapter ClpS [Formosimonas sp.]